MGNKNQNKNDIFSAFSEPQLLSTEAHGRIVDQHSFIGDEMTNFWTRLTHFFEIRLAGARFLVALGDKGESGFGQPSG
jgi:hypothetical protein